MTRCDASTDSCGGELACVCGVCTLPCSERAACQSLPASECVLPPAGEACAAGVAVGLCDVQCLVDVDCAVVSPLHRCERGACRAGTAPDGAAGSAGSGGTTPSPGEGGAGGTNACTADQVTANEVLLIGDSFLALSHQITAYLEDLARRSGALSAGERYRDASTLTANSLVVAGNGIAAQYQAAVADAEVKVVLMNGGGADTLLGTCETNDESCPLLSDAAGAVEELLATMAEDGVEHVVYAFYPDPIDPTTRAKMDALRPLVQRVCAASAVPCHWLDLRDAFAGHYDQYVQGDGLNPTDAGSQASAAAIWSVMQQYCIAQ